MAIPKVTPSQKDITITSIKIERSCSVKTINIPQVQCEVLKVNSLHFMYEYNLTREYGRYREEYLKVKIPVSLIPTTGEVNFGNLIGQFAC